MTPQESHQHSLKTLEYLALLDDYLSGMSNIAVMGAGIGLDAVWWATLHSQSGRPYNFNVTAVDVAPSLEIKTAGKMQWKFEDMSSVELPPQDLICATSYNESCWYPIPLAQVAAPRWVANCRDTLFTIST